MADPSRAFSKSFVALRGPSWITLFPFLLFVDFFFLAFVDNPLNGFQTRRRSHFAPETHILQSDGIGAAPVLVFCLRNTVALFRSATAPDSRSEDEAKTTREGSHLMLIVDSHIDIAHNAIEWNRDLLQSIARIRESEAGMSQKGRGLAMVNYQEQRRETSGSFSLPLPAGSHRWENASRVCAPRISPTPNAAASWPTIG